MTEAERIELDNKIWATVKQADCFSSSPEDHIAPIRKLIEDQIKGYTIRQEQLALDFVIALDLIDKCHHYLKANPPDKTKMSYNSWQNLVEETDYMRKFNEQRESHLQELK